MKRLPPLAIVLILGLIPLRSLLWMDDWLTHDLQGYSVRLAALAAAMDEGQWLGRWCSTLEDGYGYPLFHYYPPGFYLLGALPLKLGAGLMLSIKLAIVALQLLGIAAMFNLCRIFYRVPAAAICSLVWAFLPYQQVNIFVRGAMAEFAGLQWMVAALWLLLAHARNRRLLYAVLGAVCLAAMIVSHAVTAIIGTPIICVMLGLYLVHLRERRPRVILLATMPIVIGIALSSFYWLPALTETHYVRTEAMAGGDLHYSNHFLYWPQWLNVTYWGFGPSVPGSGDGMALHVGLAPLVLLAAGWWHVLKTKARAPWPLKVGTAGAAVLLLLTLGVSRPLWDHLPLMRYVQFPWRLLGETGVLMTLACGVGIEALTLGRLKKYVLAAMFVILAPPWHWQPTEQLEPILPERPKPTDLRARQWSLTSDDEYLPQAVQAKDAEKYPPGAVVLEGERAIICQYWFPETTVKLNARELETRPSERYGLIEFDSNELPEAASVIRNRTRMLAVGDALSIGALVLLLSMLLIRTRASIPPYPARSSPDHH